MFSTFKPVIYIQVSPERVTLRNVKSGSSISEVPEIAVSSTAGPKARSAAFSQPPNVVNPFAHPRSMVSDFAAAEQVLKQQLRRVLGSSLLSIAPRVVIHPLGDPAGGFTQMSSGHFEKWHLGRVHLKSEFGPEGACPTRRCCQSNFRLRAGNGSELRSPRVVLPSRFDAWPNMLFNRTSSSFAGSRLLTWR